MSVNNHILKTRRCVKCGKTRSDDMTVTYHNFPKPGKANITKALAWAKYCWPNENWTVESLEKLHASSKALCGRHFNSSQFYDSERQKLSKFAVPDSHEVNALLDDRDNVFYEMPLDKKCCVPNCFLTRLDGIILHCFPNPEKDPQRFRTWLNAIGGDILTLDSKIIQKYGRVCHHHFDIKFHTSSRRLSANAIPTLNLSGFLETRSGPQEEVGNINVEIDQLKCCVPNCGKTGENPWTTDPVDGNKQRITFHEFPTIAWLRTAWLVSIGVKESDLPPDPVVCSQHFKSNAFSVTSDGTVELNKDAVPRMIPNSKSAALHDKMKCCVPKCGKTGENPLTTDPVDENKERITFHEFPTIAWLRTAWLASIGVEESDLPPAPVVCSQHFKSNDFMLTSDDTVELKKYAVPCTKSVPDSKPATIDFCVICLDTGANKLYPLDKYNLAKAYTNITGLTICVNPDHSNYKPKLCSECAHRLISCDTFRDKALRTNTILMQMLQTNKVFTSQKIKSVNRVQNRLKSNLVKHTFKPDHFDLHVEHNEADIDIETIDNIHSDIDIEHMKKKKIVCNFEEHTYAKSKKLDETHCESEKDLTDCEIEYLDFSDDSENDVRAISNEINNDDLLNGGDIRNIGFTNIGTEVRSEDKYDDDTILKPDVSDVTNDESDELIIYDSYEDVEYLDDEIKDDVDDDVYNDINDDIADDSDDDVKHNSVDEIDDDFYDDTKHDIVDDINDDDNMNIDVILKKTNENRLRILNRLKEDIKPQNKVSLNNIIFVKNSIQPVIQDNAFISRIDHTNENLQHQRDYNGTKRESLTNKQTTYKVTNPKANIASGTSNEVPEVFKEIQRVIELIKHKNESNIEHENTVLNNVKSEIETQNISNVSMDRSTDQSTQTLPDGRLCDEDNLTKTGVKRPRVQKKPKTRVPKLKKLKKANKCVTKVEKRDWLEKCFKKTTLTYEEQLADLQKRKDTKDYKNFRYKCDICFKGYWCLPSYYRHMEGHTDKYGKFECAICGLHAFTRNRLYRHVRLHAQRYSCRLCAYVCSSSSLARVHHRWHTGVTYMCQHCGAQFRKYTTFFSHLRLKHPSHCSCPLCGFSFVSEAGVKAHIKLTHPFEDAQNVTGPWCDDCNIRFASEDALGQHLAVSPEHVRDGKPKRNSSVRYNYHRSKYYQLKCHRSNKRHDKNLCHLCGKAFVAAAQLRDHMMVHAGQTPYVCHVCGKGFTNWLGWRNHTLQHGDKPPRFPCAVCGRVFSRYANRIRHMLLHEDPAKRPYYACDMCDKTFTTNTGRQAHVVHVHHRVPWPKRVRPAPATPATPAKRVRPTPATPATSAKRVRPTPATPAKRVRLRPDPSDSNTMDISAASEE